MGAGKSAVALALAARLGRRHVDLDARIVATSGRSIERIFADGGEPAFRALEARLAEEVLGEESAVVALGGGAVTQTPLRRRLLAEGTLVTLEARTDVLLARVGGGEGRPLLQPDPRRAMESLRARRAAVYAECHGRVDTSDLALGEVVERVASLASEVRVPVPLGEDSYVVEVGEGYRHRLEERVAGYGGVILVADPNTERYRDEPAFEACRVTLDEGEAHKTIDAVARIWDAALAYGVDRRAMVVAVGGGVVGDLTGFAAASLLRGVAFGQVPTTVLSMVDSSVGGKTGFNRSAGKNLVGAFHQPKFVLCDPVVLDTLAPAERIAGLAEVAKAAWLEGEEAVARLERDAEALVRGDRAATITAIESAVRTKARVVALDERESGVRMLLNLGHTVGHGLEAAAGYGALRHGEAVSLGMVAAMRVAMARGRASASAAERMEALLHALGLPVDLDARLGAEVWPYVDADKKRQGDAVRFIVPGEPGQTRVETLPVDEVRRAVER